MSKISTPSRAPLVALVLILALDPSVPVQANEVGDRVDPSTQEIVVTAYHADDRIDQSPSTRATVTAQDIASKINALSAEDALKYAPSLVIRKRHVGDNFAPIATRTSGLGSSARSLIYADGVLLSALIANNNGNGSPRWTLVTPEEIARIDILYGPFSAAYPGNAIGTTVNITTRMPDRLEASARAVMNVQQFSLYGTQRTLPAWQAAATLGGRIGPFALFGAFTRTDAKSQPVTIVTIAGTANPVGTVGGYADRNRTGGAIRVVGASGLEHHVQDTWKFKAALDFGDDIRLSYLFGLWTDDTDSSADSYLKSASTGSASYLTAARTTAGFNSGVYFRQARHTAHAATLEGSAGRFDWHVIGSSYHYDRDLQSGPSAAAALPAAFGGGAGAVQRQDGTGWVTLDAKGAWRPRGDGDHVVSFGGHADRYVLDTRTYTETDWVDTETQGALSALSQGRTRTLALWAQDQRRLGEGFVLTLGARQEWWRAWGGISQTAAGTIVQPERRASRFSPKVSLEWQAGANWSARLSFGQAWRFPTVGELYQATTVGNQLANPNPNLRPERARTVELAIRYKDEKGEVGVSLFNEIVDDALISQTNITTPSITSAYVQNVDRTRARGVELTAERHDVLPRLDLQASLTYVDARTMADAGFPAAVGKLLPSVPHWKASTVVTWRPDDRWTLSAAARYASRNYATLDNSDTVGNTYQGFYKYFVADLRATYRASEHLTFGAGIDNVTNTKYFLFHPFPQRAFTADLKWQL
jgi:iron complex outermembrane receptor protein